MADEEKEEATVEEETSAIESPEDVFLNGDTNEEATCCGDEDDQEEIENGITDDDVLEPGLPRRSSLMKKDASRRPKRKKTVSFTSMDKKIATGKETYELLLFFFVPLGCTSSQGCH